MVNAGWLGVQPIVLNVIGILSTAYIARQLGPESYGRFNYGLAVVLTVGPMTDLGLRALAVRRLAQEPENAVANLGVLLSLRLVLALLTAALMLALASIMADNPATVSVIRIAALTLLPTAVMTTFVDSLVAAERAKSVSVANMVGGLVLTLLSVIVVAFDGKEVPLAIAYAAGPIVSAMILARSATATYGRISLTWRPREWRALVSEAIPFFRVGVLSSALQRLDIVIVGRLFGDASAGVYTAAVTLVDRILIIPDSVSTAMLPTLAKMRRAGQSLGHQFGDLLLGLQLLAWPLTLATIAAAPAILTLIFGPDYAPAWPVLAVAILAFPLTAAGALTGEALLAAHREDVMTRSGFRSQAVALILMYPMALFGGTIGARSSKIIGGLGVVLLRWKAVREEFPELLTDTRWPRMVRMLLVASVAYALTPLMWGRVLAPIAWATVVTLATMAATWRLGLVPKVIADMIGYLLRRRRAGNAAP